MRIVWIAAVILLAASARAQVAPTVSTTFPPPPGTMMMQPPEGHPWVPLWPEGAPGAKGKTDEDTPAVSVFLPPSNPTKSFVVVAPGGGYVHLAMKHEGWDVAQWLNAHGVAALVLRYRLGPNYHHPVELQDAQRAIRYARAHATEWGIQTDRVGMWGFSAGGHLTSTAGTHFDAGNASAADPIEKMSSRPDFLVLAYPVITMDASKRHNGSRDYLLGKDTVDPELEKLLSNELQVTAQTPPTFLFSTTDDATVPVENSVMFYEALVKAKVPAEIHIFRHGRHGVGLAPNEPDLKVWPDLLYTWLKANGWAQ